MHRRARCNPFEQLPGHGCSQDLFRSSAPKRMDKIFYLWQAWQGARAICFSNVVNFHIPTSSEFRIKCKRLSFLSQEASQKAKKKETYANVKSLKSLKSQATSSFSFQFQLWVRGWCSLLGIGLIEGAGARPSTTTQPSWQQAHRQAARQSQEWIANWISVFGI